MGIDPTVASNFFHKDFGPRQDEWSLTGVSIGSPELGREKLHDWGFELEEEGRRNTEWRFLPLFGPSRAGDDLACFIAPHREKLDIRDGAPWSATYYHFPLIEALLMSHGITYSDSDGLAQGLRSVLQGKTVVELGCRAGAFLGYLRQFGCSVHGTTDQRYIQTAREFVDTDSLKVANYSNASMALTGLNPDFVFCFNPFSHWRWSGGTAPAKEILTTFSEIAGSRGTCFVMPAADGRSTLSTNAMEKLQGEKFIRDFVAYRRPYWKNLVGTHGPNNVVYEFNF